MQARKCATCGVWKTIPSFSVDKYARDGYRKTCRACMLDQSHAAEWASTERTIQRVREAMAKCRR